MKKLMLVFLASVLTLAACIPEQPATPVGPSVEEIVAATIQALTAAAPLPATISATAPSPSLPAGGNPVSYGNVSFILPADVASNALAGTIPAVTGDDPGWGLAPEHIKFELDGYAQYETFHEPHILVYPAQEYAALNDGASRSIAKLQALLNGSAAPTAENLPALASFNAGQLFAAQVKIIQFANGSGVRFLTEYGQYFATANNNDLFYQFQGLTSDGKYYILAILPTSHPLLAFDEKPETTVPAGGIPFPGWDNENALDVYYTDVVNLLNSAAPESFSPSLSSLDALVQSINIAP
jgi:hypothetical protein